MYKKKPYSTILGGCWREIVVSVFLFGHLKSHFRAPENGHFFFSLFTVRLTVRVDPPAPAPLMVSMTVKRLFFWRLPDRFFWRLPLQDIFNNQYWRVGGLILAQVTILWNSGDYTPWSALTPRTSYSHPQPGPASPWNSKLTIVEEKTWNVNLAEVKENFGFQPLRYLTSSTSLFLWSFMHAFDCVGQW